MLHFWLLIPLLSKRGRSPRSTKTRPRTLQNAALLARPATRQKKGSCVLGRMLDGREKAQKAISPHCRGMETKPVQSKCSLHLLKIHACRRRAANRFNEQNGSGQVKSTGRAHVTFSLKKQNKGTRSQICEDGGTKRHLTSNDLAAGNSLGLQFRHSKNS